MPTILSLGQCAHDDSKLSRLASAAGASLLRVPDAPAADAILSQGHINLVLINRQLDATGEEGIPLIPTLRRHAVPIMLVSDYAEAQAAAIAQGAVPGFGKSQLAEPDVLSRIRKLLQS